MPQRVLIIDDSEVIHTLLRARLKGEPIEIYSAFDGHSGLERALGLTPDLILLDVDMPDPDGFEVCRRLKLESSLVSVPVIFLTGAASTEQKIRGLELGAVDYITKPFDPAELRARVRGALRMKFMMELLARKAQIDALTGLWNRRYFDQRLDQELSLAHRARKPLSCVIADIDRFKSINDRFGHPFGDEVIRSVAQTLLDAMRREDVLCRLGGEEFAMILPNTNLEGSLVLAERLRERVGALTFVQNQQEIHVTCSFGAADLEDVTDDTIMVAADKALYQAKEAGRNRVMTLRPTSPVPRPSDEITAKSA